MASALSTEPTHTQMQEQSQQRGEKRAVGHGSGVVLCEQHEWQVTGVLFAEFVKDNFGGSFERCGKLTRDSLWLPEFQSRQDSVATDGH